MKKRKMVLFTIFFLIFTPYLVAGQETELPIVFSINLLSPNDNAERKQYSLLMQHQLPKIGIGVYLHESTTWGNIADRSWSYPFIDYDYIPTYAEGGYDALFVKWSWDLEWDPTGVFDCSYLSCHLYGDDFYQYCNPSYNAKLAQYLTELDPLQRTAYSHEMQAMLYEDLPAISIVYPKSLAASKAGLVGIDYLLLSLAKHRSEKWDDPSDHIIKTAVPETMNAFNDFNERTIIDRKWLTSVYGSLFQRGQIHHEWEPIIALNYSLSTDGKNYTIAIDQNAMFSDGSPLLAEDIKYTYNLHMTPAVNSVNYGYLNRWLASNDSIEIIDSHTLNFNLSSTYAFSMNLFSIGILDKSNVELAISTYGYSIFEEEPLTGDVQDTLVTSCGPFMLENYSSTNVKLIQNPYWNNLNSSQGSQPYLDELSFIYYKGKDSTLADLISNIIDLIDPELGITPITDFWGYDIEGYLVQKLENQELAVNMKHPVFGTGELTPVGTPAAAKYIRKAISHAIPRNVIVDQIYEGLASPGVSPIPKVCIGFDDSLEPYAYDLDLAREYIEEAGYVPCCTTSTTGSTITVMLFALIGLTYLVFKKRINI